MGYIDNVVIHVDSTPAKNGQMYTVRELPGVIAVGTTVDLNEAIAKYIERAQKPKAKCSECGHLYEVHYATFGTQETGCNGLDADSLGESDDDYCTAACEGFTE